MKPKHLLAVTALGAMAGWLGCTTPQTGLTDGGLRPCPASPNCVISQDGDAKHHVDPIAYRLPRAQALARLKTIVAAQPGATIVSETRDYLHAEFRSKIMGFVDDVEFWLPADQPVIHVRSASRVGYSDMGVNRRRVERIRQLFTAGEPSVPPGAETR